jgi:quercetin dioxygenase-like cupin family protein
LTAQRKGCGESFSPVPLWKMRPEKDKRMELKSTLQVFQEADVPAGPGATSGHTVKPLAGSPEHPSERLTIRLASFEPGTHERLHWHMIEAFYYVLSGRAVLEDIEGKRYDIGPGSVIYAPPGIAGSHAWRVQETLQRIFVRATTEHERIIPFRVDKGTKKSRIEAGNLIKWAGARFKKSFYSA